MILMSLNSKQEEQTLRLLTFECKIEREKKNRVSYLYLK